MARPLVASMNVKGATVTYEAAQGFHDRGLIREPLFIDYSNTEIDPSQVPREFLLLPAIFNLAPVAWAWGFELEVPFRCKSMQQGLDEIRREFARLYPQTTWHDSVSFSGVELDNPESRGNALAMYSGGVDSVATILRHLEEKPELVLLEMSRTEAAAKVNARQRAQQFAASLDLILHVVSTNVGSFLDQRNLYLPDLQKERISWWSGVQHGPGISATAAPIAWANGADRVYLAASYTKTFQSPWGSAPEIDDHVAWPGTRVIHDSFDWSRQEKLRHLVHDRPSGWSRPFLAVCTRPLAGQVNCSRCEKCLRTMTGLMAEGESPADWGFDADIETAIDRVTSAFEKNKVGILDDQVFMWTDIQRRAENSESCPPRLCGFLAQLNLEPHYARTMRKTRLMIAARTMLPLPLLNLLRGYKNRKRERAIRAGHH